MAPRKVAKAAAAATTTTTTTTAAANRTARAAASRGRFSPSPPSLDRVDGPSRVSKRTPKRPAERAAASSAATFVKKYGERIRAFVAAKFTRAPEPEVGDDVRKAGMVRRTGRVGKTPATPPKSPERKAKGGRVEKTKPKPRKGRGFTSMDVPDRLAGALSAHLQLLLEGEAQVPLAAGSEDVEMSDVGEDEDEDSEMSDLDVEISDLDLEMSTQDVESSSEDVEMSDEDVEISVAVEISDVERHSGDGDLEMLDQEQAQDVPVAVDMDVDMPLARTEVIATPVRAPPVRRAPVQPQGNRTASSQAPRVAAPISLVITYGG